MVNYDMLSEIHPRKVGCKVCVKVLKMWNINYLVGESIEMIVCDENGTRFRATIFPKYFRQFYGRISEGEWKVFEKFRVTEDSTFGPKCCLYALKMVFLPFTKVQSSTVVSDSVWLEPTRFFDIIDRAYASDYLLDVVGVIHKVGPLRQIPMRNGKGVYYTLHFELINPEMDVIIPCVVRGSMATELYWKIIRSGKGHNVCALRFWLATEGYGTDKNSIVLSTSGLSEHHLNTDDPIAEEVLSKYLSKLHGGR